jgi:type I restriction enzyme S subunit
MTDAVQFPRGWQPAALADLAEYVNGYPFKPHDWSAVGLPIVRIAQMTDASAPFDRYPNPLPSEYRIDSGDLLFAWSATLTAMIWQRGPAYLNQHIFKVLPKNGHEIGFLHHLLNFLINVLANKSHGTTMKHIRRADLLPFPVIVPLPDEQARVAAVLDTVDEAIGRTEALIAKLRQIRAGLAHDLLTRGLEPHGQLRDFASHPEHFRDSPLGRMPRDWGFKQLKDLVPLNRRITYGIVQPGAFDPNGILLIRGQDYIGGWSSKEAFFKVAPSRHESYHRSLTKAGDLLVCIVGATTGAVAQVPEWIEEANITQTTARIACEPDRLVARFALYLLQSEFGQSQVRRYVKGSAQPGLNLQDVEAFWIPLPKLDEQRTIADILDKHVKYEIAATKELQKLQQLKCGLMTDLLIGRVRVPTTIAMAP